MSHDWLELTFLVPRGRVETVADVLRGHGRGVSIEERIARRDRDGGFEIDVAAPVAVRLYVCVDGSETATRQAIEGELAERGLAEDLALEQRTVREEDWAESWKRFFDVMRIGERIVICPSWLQCESKPGQVVVRLDPGMAFGTGQHETTRMCLEAVDELLRPGDRVLDVGTGSGVLAIAAALLGASSADAVDIEAVSVDVARENVAEDGVEDRVHVAHGSLGGSWPFQEPPSGRYDLVLANINANIIVSLAAELVDALAPGGRGVVSGVIDDREAEVRAALESAGARITDVHSDRDWRAIRFER